MVKIKQIQMNNIPKSKWPLVIGYFGSIHVMHCQLLEMFHYFNVLTFKDFGRKTKTQLYNFDQRIQNIKKFGPQNIYIYDLLKNNMTAEEFIQKVLLPLNPNSIVVGTNFVFGSDRQPYTLLNKYFKVDSVNFNSKISTTYISKLLNEKQVEKANSFLYKPYYYVSQWIEGKKRGRELGFKTINLRVKERLALCSGSYVAKIKFFKKAYDAVAFVGSSKTFNMKVQTIEIHVLHNRILPRCFYPKFIRNKVYVEFYKYIRDNKKYTSPKLLKNAIQKDINIAKAYFERNK